MKLIRSDTIAKAIVLVITLGITSVLPSAVIYEAIPSNLDILRYVALVGHIALMGIAAFWIISADQSAFYYFEWKKYFFAVLIMIGSYPILLFTGAIFARVIGCGSLDKAQLAIPSYCQTASLSYFVIFTFFFLVAYVFSCSIIEIFRRFWLGRAK